MPSVVLMYLQDEDLLMYFRGTKGRNLFVSDETIHVRLKIPQLAVFASAFVRERDYFAQYGPKYAVADTDEEQCFYFSPGDGWHDRAALCVCMWVSACCVSVDFVQRLCARLMLVSRRSVGWDFPGIFAIQLEAALTFRW